MKITLLHNGSKKSLRLRNATTINDVIQRLGLNEETFIIKLNGRIAHPATRLKEGDALEFVNVIYGG